MSNNSDSDNEFEVKEIVGSRSNNGETEYRVKWASSNK